MPFIIIIESLESFVYVQVISSCALEFSISLFIHVLFLLKKTQAPSLFWLLYKLWGGVQPLKHSMKTDQGTYNQKSWHKQKLLSISTEQSLSTVKRHKTLFSLPPPPPSTHTHTHRGTCTFYMQRSRSGWNTASSKL